jgi:type IV pilus assembly protein PilM
MNLTDRLTSLLKDPPPVMAFEISQAGIAVARLGQRTELDFQPLKPGSVVVSPLKDNVIDIGELAGVVRSVSGGVASRKRRDVAVILPDYCTRTAVLDFDSFPSDPKEQLSLIRFRIKRSVPFDVDSAAISYSAQPAAGKRFDVVVVLAPLEIVSRYEAPFRAVGMTPGFVTTSSIAALELAPEAGLSIVAKLSGHVLTVLVRDKATLKLVRCLELPSNDLADVASYLFPTFVYVEDNLGARAGKLMLCGFGATTDEAQRHFQDELGIEVEPLRSPFGPPGENNAGLLGYLRSISRNN